MEKVKILLVDDHPVILEGYKNILQNEEDFDIIPIIDTANNCEEAISKVKSSAGSYPFQIIFLDISLPPSIKYNILSGEDLGLRIKELLPEVKIIVHTMFTDNLRLYNILKNLKPHGLLIKSDFSSAEFYHAFKKILNGETYYSQTVNNLIRKQFGNEMVLDNIDRQLLYHISRGVKTKDLSSLVNLSLPAVEKRKKIIKEALGVEKGGDMALISKARDLGFL